MAEKKLFLLDAFALIYRAHFAFARNPRFNSKGMNTSAIFGFTNSLLEVLNNQKPTHLRIPRTHQKRLPQASATNSHKRRLEVRAEGGRQEGKTVYLLGGVPLCAEPFDGPALPRPSPCTGFLKAPSRSNAFRTESACFWDSCSVSEAFSCCRNYRISFSGSMAWFGLL